jgi:hypothetical protein
VGGPWGRRGGRSHPARLAVRITEVHAYATSFPVPAEATVRLGIGRAVKRDTVVVSYV